MMTRQHAMIPADARKGLPALTEEQERFFRVYYTEIYVFCMSQLNDREAAEDIVARAFYTLFFSTHVSLSDELTGQIVLYYEAKMACQWITSNP